MFATMFNPSAAYRKAGVESKIETASPHELVVMLYDGALSAIVSAKLFMEQKDIRQKGDAIGKALDIIEQGLRACLDYTAGGEIAAQLSGLYEYMCARLLYANLNNDPAALDEVFALLTELRSAWEEIATDPAVVSATNSAA